LDHKWGRNVIDLGLGDLGATLAARNPSFPQQVWYNVTYAGGSMCWYALTPLDTNDPYIFGVGPVVPAGTHFPYNRPVEPDVPL